MVPKMFEPLKFDCIEYDYLYHARQNQHPHAYHSLYLSIFVFSSARWKKRKKVKRRQNNSASGFSFTQYTSTLCRCIQNLTTLALIGAEKSVMKNFIGEKKNDQIMGMTSMTSMTMLILSYMITSHTQCLYKISKS